MSFGSLPSSGVFALGNFDGVHLGHRAVLQAAKQKAQAMNCPTYAMTFTPHPCAFFQKETKPFRLTPCGPRVRLLKEAGADDVAVLPFTKELAALSAEDFIQTILIDLCRAQHVTVGFDFVFGADRRGDRDLLRQKLNPLGIGVTEVPPFRDEGGEIVSSSRIREALWTGDIPLANALLGRPFSIEGTIILGDQRGRTLGMPTANMALDGTIRPLFGVYAVTARRVGSSAFLPGVANIGCRPTINDHTELLETHLFDFERDIYGEEWEIFFHAFLRSEQKFTSLDVLKAQMQTDALLAKEALKE